MAERDYQVALRDYANATDQQLILTYNDLNRKINANTYQPYDVGAFTDYVKAIKEIFASRNLPLPNQTPQRLDEKPAVLATTPIIQADYNKIIGILALGALGLAVFAGASR